MGKEFPDLVFFIAKEGTSIHNHFIKYRCVLREGTYQMNGNNYAMRMPKIDFFNMDSEIECPQCDGEGISCIEVWVDNYPNGGFISERMGNCPN